MRKNVIQWCALAVTGAAFVAGCAEPATKGTGVKNTGGQASSTTGGGMEVPLPAGGGNAAQPMPEPAPAEPTPAEPTPAKPEEKPAEPAPAKPEEKPADAPKEEAKPADAPKEEAKPAETEKKPE